MAKVMIKTTDEKYVGGGRDPERVDSLSRAYLYEDCEATDAQIAVVNALYGCGWRKVDAEKEKEALNEPGTG